jgi:hypothetical protein
MMRTRRETRARSGPLLTHLGLLTIAAITMASGGCQKSTQKDVVGPESFASPESAGRAVYLAAHAGDTHAMLAIFGQDARDLLFTGDHAQDALAFHDFCVDYDMMHRWARLKSGALELDVGTENYPFPFPIEERAKGQWVFSNAAARKEVLARRIGQNELAVINVLSALVGAQREYFGEMRDGKPKQYAQRFQSRPGKHDGLYWKAVEGQTESPLGPLVARASVAGFQQTAEKPEPFHGYFYRMVTQQGGHARGGTKKYAADGMMTEGFAFVAYPAAYRETGVMTFQVNQEGVIYQKDLGSGTAEAAHALDSFNLDENWAVVQ